jgi:hypothetical protein
MIRDGPEQDRSLLHLERRIGAHYIALSDRRAKFRKLVSVLRPFVAAMSAVGLAHRDAGGRGGQAQPILS